MADVGGLAGWLYGDVQSEYTRYFIDLFFLTKPAPLGLLQCL